jgi:alkyl hydroperoxide reductase subunit F
MLDTKLKTQLQSLLEKISQPIELRAALDNTPASTEITALLNELSELSSLITISIESDLSVRTPSFTVARLHQTANIRFAGVPLGHEFSSLVLALLQVGGHPSKASIDLIEAIKAMPDELVFETYISLSCQSCPDVVQALNLMAVLNPNIRHTMIDGALFQHEVEDRQIMSVPAVYLNGQPFSQGRISLEEMITKLDLNISAKQVATISARAPFDMLVIGGGPAGASAAIYAARKGIRTGVAAERFGGQVLDTASIENLISVKETEGPQLARALEEHVKSYAVDIMSQQQATTLTPGQQIEVGFSSGATLLARTVVIATGARWREMDVPGEALYRNRGVAYCPHCDGPLFKGKAVAVIGGGNSGVEAAIDLAGMASHVTLLEYDTVLRADAVLTDKLRSLTNVTVFTQAQTTEVIGDGSKVTALLYRDRPSGEIRRVELAGIFVQIGLIPNTDWLKGIVKLSPRGEIEVDARGETSVPGVFAAGDCTTVPFKQIVIAIGEGAKAALGAFDYLIRLPVAKAA